MVNERSQHACCPSLDERRGVQAEIILPVFDLDVGNFYRMGLISPSPRMLVDLPDFGRNSADMVLALKVHRSRRAAKSSCESAPRQLFEPTLLALIIYFIPSER
jgi:hypothetical protein